MAKSNMTFIELCQDYGRGVELDEGLPASVDGQAGELARIVRDIRQANLNIQLLFEDWTFRRKRDLVAVTAASSNDVTITTPSDVDNIGAWDRDSFWINKTAATAYQPTIIEYEDWRDNYFVGTEQTRTSQPESIVIMPDLTLKTFPVANAVYNLTADYFHAAVDFSTSGGGAETSVIPGDFRRLIVLYAFRYYARRETAPEYIEQPWEEYDELMIAMIARCAPNHQQRARLKKKPGRCVVR